MLFEKELQQLEVKKNNLEKKDIDLIVTDFDSTIFSRKEQLEEVEGLRLNRGEKGNIYVRDVYGIDNLVKDFYIGKKFPQTIVSQLRENHDLILTKGMFEFSDAKIKGLGLDRFNYIVVDETIDKIITTIKYVVNTLGFIPNKITVYEDRPKDFIANKTLIENFLETKVEIMYVEMTDNYNEPKITKID